MLPEKMRPLKPGFGLGGIVSATLREPHTCVALAEVGLTRDEYWMAAALRKAMDCAGLCAPNPAVGCVFVKNEMLLGSGGTSAWGGPHAERNAVAAVLAAHGNLNILQGATAYVTLEPCSHTGKQPPCAELLETLQLARVVVALQDPNPLVAGAGIFRLKEKNIAVDLGVLAPECLAWNLPFVHQMQRGRPLVVGKWAQGLDGGLALADGTSRWISSKQAREYTHYLRQKYDAIAVGAGTFFADLPSLTSREAHIPALRQPVRMVVDPRGRLLQSDFPILMYEPDPRDVASSRSKRNDENDAHEWLGFVPHLAYLEKNQPWGVLTPRGVLRLVPIFSGGTDWAKEYLTWLHSEPPLPETRLPLQSVLVEGGAQLLDGLWELEGLDAICSVIAPKILGVTPHRLGATTGSLKAPERLRTCAVHNLDPDVVFELWDPSGR